MAKRPAPRRLYLSENRRKFLDAVREHGTIRAGALAARMTRGEVLGLFQAVPGFQQAYELALADFRDSMEERALRVADEGDASTLRFRLRAEIPEKYGPRPGRSPSPPGGQPRSQGPAAQDSPDEEIDPAYVWDLFERLAAQHDAARKRNTPTPTMPSTPHWR